MGAGRGAWVDGEGSAVVARASPQVGQAAAAIARCDPDPVVADVEGEPGGFGVQVDRRAAGVRGTWAPKTAVDAGKCPKTSPQVNHRFVPHREVSGTHRSDVVDQELLRRSRWVGIFVASIRSEEGEGEVVGGGLSDARCACDGGPGELAAAVEFGEQTAGAFAAGLAQVLGVLNCGDQLVVGEVGDGSARGLLLPGGVVTVGHIRHRRLPTFRKSERLWW